jgi:hypothetical protein
MEKLELKMEKLEMEKSELKINWKCISIIDWIKNVIEEPLFVAHGSDLAPEHGYFEGYNELTTEQRIILDENLECFYYNSKQCNIGEDDDPCECYLGREYSSMYIELLIHSEEDDIVQLCIKPLMNEFKELNNNN